MINSREIYVIANDIRSLYNVGSLFRLCDGVGVKKLFLCGTTGAPHNRIKFQRQRTQIAKTALEGLDAVDWEYHNDPSLLIEELKKQHIQTIAIELTDHSQPYARFEYKSRICLVLGNETDGVPNKILNQVDAIVELPMLGKGKSLNVITATSAVLYHIRTEAIGNS